MPELAAALGGDAAFSAVYRPDGRAPGGRVSASACRRSPRRSRPSPTRGSTRSTRATSGSVRRAGSAAAGSAIAARDLAPATPRPGASRSPSTTAASASPPTRRTARASSRSSCCRSWRASSRRRASAFGPTGVTDPAWIHLGIEAAKLAMADRDRHLTDPEARDVPVERLLDPAHAAVAGGADRPAHGPPSRRPSTNPPGGGTVYLGVGRRRGQRGQPHRIELVGLRLGRRRPGDRRSSTRTAATTSASTRTTRTSWRRASGRSTRCSPGCCSVPASPVRGSWPGRWAATPSRRSTPSSCRRSSTAASTSRRRSPRPRWFVGPADAFRAAVEVRLEPRHVAGVVAGPRRPRSPADPRPRRSTAASGEEHAIELVDGGPGAPDGSLAAATDPRSEGLPAVW